MQSFAKVSSLGTSYSAAQVQSFLSSQTLQEKWAFDHLDQHLAYIEDLTPWVDVDSAEIQHDTKSGVKRTLRMEMRGDKNIATLSHCIRPRYQLRAPDGGWIDFSLGIFPITPYETDIYPLGTWRKVQCSDFLQLLVDSTLTKAFTVPAGGNYVSAINALVQTYGGVNPVYVQIPDPGLKTPSSWTFDTGTARLTAINYLLDAMNYFPLWTDENGFFRSTPIPDYNTVGPSYTFDTTQGNSTVGIPIKKTPDYAKVFNICTVISEDPRKKSFSVTYSNTDQSNPISVGNWHPKTKIIRKANLNAAQALQIARYNVQYASMMFNATEIDTLPWPTSQDNDVYQVIYQNPDEGLVQANFVEIGWTHSCRKGASTKHTMLQVLRT